MSDGNPRSKLEFLYREVLGEVDSLISRLEKVDLHLLEQTDEARSKLLTATGQIVLAARGIETATDKHRTAIEEWTAAKADQAHQAVRTAATEEVGHLQDRLSQTMAARVDAALGPATDALRSAAAAQASAVQRMRYIWWIAIAAAPIGGIIGSICALLVAK